jgi:hypothetical protein
MLIGFDDPDVKVFQQELERLGWSRAAIFISTIAMHRPVRKWR